jgi:hypothetical protein
MIADASPPAEAPATGPVTRFTIREYAIGRDAPTRTIRIPTRVLTLAARFVPRKAREELEQHGIEVDAILQAAREIQSPTVLVEIEEHDKGRRIVVALE